MKEQTNGRRNERQCRFLMLLAGVLLLLAILLSSVSPVYGATFTWTKMPSGTGIPTGTQIKLPASKASISYSNAYTCKTKSYTNDDGTAVKALCVKITKNKANTFNNVATIKYSNVGNIAGRSFDVTVTFTKVVVSQRSGDNLSLGTDNQMCFARVYGNVIGISTDAIGQGAYKAQKQITANVKVTWSGTSTVVPKAFYQGVKDIDAGFTSNYYKEAWQAGSGFASKLYYWPQCVNSRSTAGKMTTTGTSTSGNNQWYQTGLIAPTTGGNFTGTFTSGHCGSSLSLYSQYMDVPAPTKSVDRAKSIKGDTINWTIQQKIGTFYRDMFTPYTNLILSDTLPAGVTYNSAKVYNSKGTDITARGTLAYNTSTRKLTFTFSAGALSATDSNIADLYNGGTIRMVITTIAELPDTVSKTLSNQSISTISGLDYTSNTVTTIIQRPDLMITKVAGGSEYEARETIPYTVTVKQITAGLTGNNTVITDALPDGLTLSGEPQLTGVAGTVSTSGNTWTVNLPELAYGQTATITFPARAEDVTIEKEVTNTVKATMEDAGEQQASATVKILPIPLDIQVEKVWEDEDDFYGLRPDHIDVELLQDGKAIHELTLRESEKWKGVFEDLPEYRTETERYEYTVREASIPDGYKVSIGQTEESGEFEREISITNRLAAYELTIRKEIPKTDVYTAHGDATFLFAITSKENPNRKWYTEIVLTDGQTESSGGMLTGTKTLSLPYGEYLVEELPALRYQGGITETEGSVTVDETKQNALVKFQGKETEASVTYMNEKTRWDRYSHNDLVINRLR